MRRGKLGLWIDLDSLMLIQTKNVVLIFLSLCVLLEGCVPNHTVEEVSPGEYANPLILDRISEKQGGIIGGYEFYTVFPSFLNDAKNAVGRFAVYDKEGKLVSSGVGTHMRDSRSGREFILTAAHLVYDTKTNERRGDSIFFGDINGKLPNLKLDISGYPQVRTTKSMQDWLTLGVENNLGRSPYVLNVNSRAFYLNTDVSQEYSGYFVSISSVVGNDPAIAVWFAQKADQLYLTNFMNRDIVVSNLDAINGMSGSPVFYIENEALHLVGVISSRSKYHWCEDVQSIVCATRIGLLPNHKKRPAK